MEVNLINKEDCKNFFKTWGEFACVCYDTDKKHAERVGKSCLESGHFSGSRAFSFVFEIKDVSRRCTHQLVRHSVGVTINQRSQRYCSEEDFKYVTPPSIKNNPNAKKFYDNCMKEINVMYSLLNNGLSKHLEGEELHQDTRYLLPNACVTELTMGFTLEALIHFCEERMCTASQWEIRALANAMKKEVVEVLPELDKYLNAKCVNLGYCPESSKRCCGKRPNKENIKIININGGK